MAGSASIAHARKVPWPWRGRIIRPWVSGRVSAPSFGRPVIATNAGGVPEIIDDGVSGLLVPCDEVAALADAMAYLHDHSDEANAIAEEGRRRATQRFAPARFASEMMAVYDAVLWKSTIG